MDPTPSLDDLIKHWHELRQQGQTLSLEQLCAGSPERLDELRRHVRAVAQMESFLAVVADDDESTLDQLATPPAKPARSEPTAVPEGLAGYEILGELGRGGMGVVYRARQKGLNRTVALKMILAGKGAGAEQVARFRTEAEAVAHLQHPNIVQVYETGEHDGQPFFSLEYVEAAQRPGVVWGALGARRGARPALRAPAKRVRP
jgi:serine/threonine-protein kinase